MRKGKGWRVFRWVDVLGLGAWLGMCPVPHAQAQPRVRLPSRGVHVVVGRPGQWALGGDEALGPSTQRRMGHMCSAVANPQPPTPTT